MTGTGNSAPRGLIGRARELVAQGDLVAAQQLLREAWERKATRRPGVGEELQRVSELLGDLGTARRVRSELAAMRPAPVGKAELEKVRQLLKAGDPVAARALLAPLLDRPRVPADAFLLMARLHAEAGECDAGLQVLDRAVARCGASSLISESRATLLLRAGRQAEARAVREAAWERWPDQATARHGQARVLLEEKRYAECLALLAPVIADGKGVETDAAIFAQAAMWAGDFPQLAGNLPALEKCWSDPRRHAALALAVALATGGDAAAGSWQSAITAPLASVLIDDCRRYAVALLAWNRAEAAGDLLAFFLALAPGAGSLESLAVLLAYRLGDEVAAHDMLRRVHAAGKVDPRDIPEIVQSLANADDMLSCRDILPDLLAALIRPQDKAIQTVILVHALVAAGDPDTAKRLLETVDVSLLDTKVAGGARALGVQLGVGLPGVPAAVGDIAPTEWLADGDVAHYRFGSDMCVILFSGVAPAALTVLLDRCLPTFKQLGVSVMAVYDRHRLAALVGFGDCYPDRHASEGILRELLASRGYRRFFTCGNSTAAYSAVLYGIEMGAAGALTFSAPTFLPGGKDSPHSFGALTIRRLRRQLPETECWDLCPLLKGSGALVVHNHYGARSVFDVWMANRIDGLPGVQQFPGDFDVHDSVTWLQENGLLAGAISGFIDAIRQPGQR